MNKSNNEIRNMSENWALDERNGYPYSGQSVQNFIKKTFGEKAGDFFYDTNTNKYLIFADSDSRNTYLLDREENSDLLLGTFDAPANYTAEINMSTPASNVILSGTTGNYIDFTFDIKNKNGASAGDSVIATYTFNNSGNIKKETRIYDAGTNVHFLVDEFISTGTNNINVVITGRNTLASSMAAVTFTIVNLELTSSFNFAEGVTKGVYLHVPYNLKGSNVKYLEWYIDGVAEQDVDTVVGLNVNATKDFDTSELTVGKHNIQARAYITNNGTNYYSKTLYFDFVVKPENDTWESNVTYVLLGLLLNNPTTTTLSVNVKQYQTFNYSVAVFDSRQRSLALTIADNGTQIKNISMPIEEVVDETYTPLSTGNHILTFTTDSQTATFTVVGQQSDIDITEETDGLLLKLSAKGRSNNEVSPNTWAYTQAVAQGGNTISTTFTGFSWNAQSGWNDDALIIPAGSSINIGLNPLAGNPITKGRTIEIDFETTNIDNEQASILSLLNGTAGLSITASTAKLQTLGGTKVETKFRDGDRIRLSFIINRTDDTDNSRMLYIVNNGILERAARFDANDSIGITGDSITIGSTGCNVKLYSVSVYDKSITVDQAFCNYAVNNPNIISIASFNDIYDEMGNIDVDKVNAHIPVMIVTGDISSIMSISDKSHKNDWNTNPVDIEFRNMQNPEMNFFIDDADIRLQGTSSISYPRKNFRIYSKSESGKYATKFYTPTHDNSDLVDSGKYSFKSGSAPVTCWCLKADFAESSGSHNTGIARLWNNIMKNTISGSNYILRTDAQNWAETYNYPYDVRTTVDGFPIVLFQRDTTNSPLVCLGQYNFNNDKSTEDVYGFTALTDGEHTFDNSHVECWEVLDSNNSIALFTDVSNFDSKWDDAFEARYPKRPTTTALKRVAQFINSCYDSTNDTVNVATWRAGKANYFDLNKLAAYYIYLLRFGAVDQTVKNAMFTTEDGEHWFYINYDNDTILGIDNESRQFDTWDYGLFTQTPNGGYYYDDKGKSVLWRCFEADSECMALARQIDDLLFKAGLTYENICETFDDDQSSQWCERIYNENGRYKYISQALQGKNVLYMLQGSRKSHRHWYLQHRFEKYDNVFGNGTYSIRSIQARAIGTVSIPQGAAYKFTPAINSSFGYAVASTTVDVPTERTAGTEYTATGLPQETGVGNWIYIYNANNISAIDLSAYINALGSLNIGDAVDVNGNSRLTKLVLGDGTNTNSYLDAISGLSNIKSLEEIDIRGYQAITNMDLSTLTNLHTVKASNSGLTSFAPANGISLTSAILPSSIQTIALNDANVTAITYTPTTTLRKVELKNVTGSWDTKTFVNTWLALLSDAQLANAELTLTGINWTGMTGEQAVAMGKVGTKNYQGKITLTSFTEEQYNQLVELFGANVFNPDSSFVIDAPTQVFISGPSQVKAGNTGTFTASFFPLTEDSIKYLLYNGSTLVTAQTDQQGNVYRTYNGVTLYEATGVMSVASLESDVAVKVRAQVDGTEDYSSYIDVTAVNITYPTAVTINGTSPINSNGMYNYTKSLSGTYNAEVTNVAWSLSSNSASTLYSSDANSATVNVTNTPATSTTVTLTCTVTFEGGVTRTGTKTITIVLTFPSSVSISGPANIADNGDYEYTKTINGSYTASLTGVTWSLTSNANVAITSSNNGKAVVGAHSGNDTAVTLTLTCVCTFSGGTTRTATKSISVSTFDAPPVIEWVDLGLPSGLLWCTHNVGASSDTEVGLYFAWGETTGYASAKARNTALGRSDGFSSDSYDATGASAISANLTLAQDAAQAYMGADWRMPTKAEFDELISGCNVTWTSKNGVRGGLFTSNTNGNSIFIRAAGVYNGNDLYESTQTCSYYSSTYSNTTYTYLLYIMGTATMMISHPRAFGRTIRPVREAPKAVDLGLPSGKLWADRNIGAITPEATGLYFAWGETVGYKDAADRNTKLGLTGGFDYTASQATGANSISADLTDSNDAAVQNLGNGWRMPTKAELQELCNNTNHEWTTVNGVAGRKFTNKNNSSKYIFMPACGIYSSNGTQLSKYGDTGYYWSSTHSAYSSAYFTYFKSSIVNTIENTRYWGMSVRPIQDV